MEANFIEYQNLPDSVLRDLHVPIYLILKIIVWNRYFYFLSFVDEETEGNLVNLHNMMLKNWASIWILIHNGMAFKLYILYLYIIYISQSN